MAIPTELSPHTNHKHGKFEVKVHPVGVNKAHDGVELQRHLFLTSALLGGVKTLTPRPLYPPRKVFQYPEHEARVSGYGQNALDWSTRAYLPDRPVVTEGNNIYKVSQEECARFRESVPYVKLYRYNPKHLYPKLNGYGDNGQRSLKL